MVEAAYRTLSTFWGERARVRGEVLRSKFPSFGGVVHSTGVVLPPLRLLPLQK